MANLVRDLFKERSWQRWIAKWQRSGLSVRGFCRRHELSETSFHAWRRELVRRETETVTSPFVPVHVIPTENSSRDSSLEVVLRGGRCVRVAPGFDPATLKQLVTVLEDQQPC